MGYWAPAFLLAIGLHLHGTLALDGALTLPLTVLLAVVVAWPWPAAWRRWVHLASLLPALALLYHQSRWPAPERLLALAQAAGGFDLRYLASLLLRATDFGLLATLLAAGLLLTALSRRLRLSTWVFAGLLGLALLPLSPWRVAPAAEAEGAFGADPVDDRAAAAAGALGGRSGQAAGDAGRDDRGAPAARAPILTAAQAERAWQAYHDNGREMRLRLPRGDNGPPPFDLLILNLCSLGWDDLAQAGLRDAPLLRRFDLVFDRFNSGATYSAPSALRLLQSNCGAAGEAELYGGVPSECLLWRNLEQAGYEPALLLNHDGRYGRFGEVLRREGGIDTPIAHAADAAVALRAFDGSPIGDDGEVLTRWWRERTAVAGAAPLALLYNSITLHDGNRDPDGPALPGLDTWAPRARRLLEQLMRFVALVEASGRPTVLVLVAEHGAALRGDARQVAGLRELPMPAVTHVPAGVMLLGFGPRRSGPPVHVTQVSGHLALMTAVAALMHGGPAAAAPERLAEIARALPTGDWVAENGRSVYLQGGPHAWLRDPDGSWSPTAAVAP
jgi:cellulose synthase operon protein YhjU